MKMIQDVSVVGHRFCKRTEKKLPQMEQTKGLAIPGNSAGDFFGGWFFCVTQNQMLLVTSNILQDQLRIISGHDLNHLVVVSLSPDEPLRSL